MTGLEDFGFKLNGKRAASHAFVQALFRASGFEKCGIVLEQWLASDEDWQDCLKDLHPIDNRASLKGCLTPDQITANIAVYPTTRAMGDLPANTVSVSDFVELTLKYSGREALSSAYIALIDWESHRDVWTALSSHPALEVSHKSPVAFLPSKDGLAARIRPAKPIAPPRGDFELYFLIAPRGFDHRIAAILDNVEPSTARVRDAQMGKLVKLIETAKRSDLLVASLSYFVS